MSNTLPREVREGLPGAISADDYVKVDGKFFRPADAVVYGPSVRAEVEAQETQINRKRECFRGTASKERR